MQKTWKKEYAIAMINYFKEEKEVLPSFVRFALSLGCDLATLQKWRKKPVFERAYRHCEDILCDRIILGAMQKRFDSSFSKFLLERKLGFDQEDTTCEALGVRFALVDDLNKTENRAAQEEVSL